MIVNFPALFKASADEETQPHDAHYDDFLPYACHFDARTILTKNGEVFQTIKIKYNNHGLPQEVSGASGTYLRHAIRQALSNHKFSGNFAFWIHTTRTREPLNLQFDFSSEFAHELDAKWNSQHKWKYAYENEVFITIMRDGQAAKFWSANDIKQGYVLANNRSYREAHLQEAVKELNVAVERLLAHLRTFFQAEVLTIREEQPGSGKYISEQAEFLGRLFNLTGLNMPVRPLDLSQQIRNTTQITFGFNAIESQVSHENKRFAAVLSIKHFHELPLDKLDTFLQLPVEMIITQSFDHVPQKKVFDQYKELFQISNLSQSKYITHASRLHEMKRSKDGASKDFVKQSTYILLIVEEYRDLEPTAARVQNAVSKLGLVAVREDIRMEDFFWAQMPGNFEFIRRQQFIPMHAVGGMARLNYYPLGERTSVWGEPVAVLPTALHTPYLFHYHVKDNGHTVLLDYNSFPDSMCKRLMYFLISQTTRFKGRVIVFDQGAFSIPLTQALRGKFVQLHGGKALINPFMISNTRRNQGFVAAWLTTLLGTSPEDESTREQIRSVVASVFNGAVRNLDVFMAALMAAHPVLGAQLQNHLREINIASLFSKEGDSFDFSNHVTVVNLEPVMKNEQAKIAIFSYLMHQIISTLDGTPTMIVLKDAWELLDNAFFAPRLESLMEMLKENNAMLFMTASDPDKVGHSAITPDIMRLAATRIYIPDDVPVDYQVESVGLTTEEEAMLLKMERQKGDFLIKHGEEVIPSQFMIADEALLTVLKGESGSTAAEH